MHNIIPVGVVKMSQEDTDTKKTQEQTDTRDDIEFLHYSKRFLTLLLICGCFFICGYIFGSYNYSIEGKLPNRQLFEEPLDEQEIPGDSSPDKIVVDVDVGPDDALALMLLFRYEEMNIRSNKLLAITCTHGNTGLMNVANNANKVLQFLGKKNVSVYLGAEESLVYKQTSDNYFGKDGFGDFSHKTKPQLNNIRKQHAVVALLNLVNRYPGEITLFALGPLTNIALAIKLDPDFLSKLKMVYIAAGAVAGIGNVKPGIEFNSHVDPEALSIVLQKSVHSKVILFPFDTVFNAGIPMDWRRQHLSKIGSEAIQFFDKAEMISERTDEKFWTPADLMTVFAYLQPCSIVKMVPLRVTSVTCGEARGGLLIDHFKAHENVDTSNVNVVLNFDVEMFKDAICRIFNNNS